MDQRLKNIVDDTSLKFGLEEYRLETWHLRKRFDDKGILSYSFNMEWFPKHTAEPIDEDANPDGAVSIEYMIREGRYESVVFVQGKSFSTEIFFISKTVEEVAAWVKQETGLSVGEDIRLTEIQENGFQFQSDVEGIQLSPDLLIEVKFDDEGRLLYFVSFGTAPAKEEIEKGTFSMMLEEIESIVKQQLQLVEFPSEERKRFVPVYAMEEVFITVSNKKLIPFFTHERSEVKVDDLFEWDEPLPIALNREEVFFDSVVSPEEAFGEMVSITTVQLSGEEVKRSLAIAKDVVRTVYPDESGIWKVESLSRDENMIQVKCRRVEEDSTVFKRKFVVFIDPKTYKLLNYMDNNELFEVLNSFAPAEKALVSHEEAFEKMIPYISLDPTYVYDPEVRKYVLCGLLDASEGVDAVTGEIVALRDL